MSIKLLIGGSPCTYWSIAQTNNRETKAEGIGWELFKNYLIAKEKFKPDFFLYENNKSAAQAIKDQITQELGVGVDPMARFTYVNSALVSAQNRQRFYVTNFGEIEQPEDRGILLKDILETGNTDGFMGAQGVIEPLTPFVEGTIDAIVEKYGYLPEQFNPYNQSEITDKAPTQTAQSANPAASSQAMMVQPVNTTSNGKAVTLKAQYYKNGTANLLNDNTKGGKYAASGVAEPVCVAQRGRYADTGNRSTKGEGGTEQFYEARTDGKTNALTTVQKDNAVAEPVRVGSLPRPNGELSTSQAMRIYAQDGKSITQSAGGGGLGGKTGLYAIPVEFENGIPTKAVSCADGKTYTVYKVENGIITIKEKEYPIKLQDGYYIIRKLTVRECARLQTMPDDYCKAVSDSQAYKALGNGWTAEVITHLLNHALKDVPRDEEIVVLSMYDGIATGRYCLDKMGFTNVKYHAYEIDKYPIQIALDNYPDIIQHGDAFAVREDDWKAPQPRTEWHDELLGGAE